MTAVDDCETNTLAFTFNKDLTTEGDGFNKHEDEEGNCDPGYSGEKCCNEEYRGISVDGDPYCCDLKNGILGQYAICCSTDGNGWNVDKTAQNPNCCFDDGTDAMGETTEYCCEAWEGTYTDGTCSFE